MSCRAAVLLAVVCLILTACGGGGEGPRSHFKPREPQAISVDDPRIVRDSSWDAAVAQPQAEWAPGSYMIAARSIQGLMLVREGVGSVAYRTDDGSSPWDPRFWGEDRLVAGPEARITLNEDGHITAPPSGLLVSAFSGDALQRPKVLSESGYRPRPWGQYVVCSSENRILLIDQRGKEEFFVEGFMPEPQADGPGIAWQETPVFTHDYWTGNEGTGDLVIRWEPGVVDILPRGVHPRWTPWGGIVATRLHGDVPARGDWYAVGSDVVHIAGPGVKPVVVMADAHLGEPHPLAPFAAVVANDGRVHLAELDGSAQRLFVDLGERPRWSDDGKRLMLEEPHADDPRSRTLRTYILGLSPLEAE